MKLGDNLILFIAHFKREILYDPNQLPLLHTLTSKLREEPKYKTPPINLYEEDNYIPSELVEQGFFLNSKYEFMNEWIDGWIFHISYFDRMNVILNLVMFLLLTNKHILVTLPFLKKGTDPILLSQV